MTEHSAPGTKSGLAGRETRVQPGSVIDVVVEKATAGGRMLARHNGQIVFVSGAIPGEHVRARVARAAKGALYAEAEHVIVASPDRRPTTVDGRCGGNVFNHVSPERQIRLKGEILDDAFRRVARLPLDAVPQVHGSPEQGYRMRARLHVQGDRVGFLREGSHDLCDAAVTGQLLAETVEWIRRATESLRRGGLIGLQSIEIAENIPANERACHLDIVSGDEPSGFRDLSEGLTGLSVQMRHAPEAVQLTGHPFVGDELRVLRGESEATLRLTRDVRAFFQGNRYLLGRLVSCVAELVPDGPVVDLYAGVGLFGLSLAALGWDAVQLVEGDRISGESLARNAEPFGHRVQVRRVSVEQFLRAERGSHRQETVIVDPPRTGLSPEAIGGLIRRRPAHIVYVSCDPATLARDARLLIDAGYDLRSISGFDLFPNTAHVESVSAFVLA